GALIPLLDGLRVPGTLRGHSAQGLAGGLRIRPVRNVAEGYDPNEPFVAIEDGEPADLQLRHILCNSLDVILIEAVPHFGGHDIAHHGASRVATAGVAANGDVTVRHHPYQPVVLTHGKDPRIRFRHQAGSMLEGIFGTGDANGSRHDLTH